MMKRLTGAFPARHIVFWCLLIFFALPVYHVSASKSDVAVVKKDPSLSIMLGKAELVELSGPVSDVLIADSSVISVQAVQANRLYIVGTAIGDTNLMALDEDGNLIKKLDVHVTQDLAALRGFVKKMFPKEDVIVDSLHGQVFLSGEVSTPEIASKIANVVGHYVSELQGGSGDEVDEMISNLMKVRGEQQVMLQVRVVEASRSFIRDLGLRTVGNDLDELSATQIFGGFPSTSSRGGNASVTFGTGGGVGLPNDPAASFRFLTDSAIPGIGDIGVFLDALEREDLISVLAEPNLTAISGQQAGFLAGGEFPVPIGRDRDGNIIVEYREFGVSLNFKPVVLSDDRISMQLDTEVSSLDFVNSVGAGDLIVPGLDIRRAETTIEIPSGGSLMIAGLLQSDTVEGLSGLPGIRKAPILGDLISSKSFTRNETELVVMVTAYMVEPFADKTRSEDIPKQRDNPLAEAFAVSIRNRFANINEDVFDLDKKFGYLLD